MKEPVCENKISQLKSSLLSTHGFVHGEGRSDEFTNILKILNEGIIIE